MERFYKVYNQIFKNLELQVKQHIIIIKKNMEAWEYSSAVKPLWSTVMALGLIPTLEKKNEIKFAE